MTPRTETAVQPPRHTPIRAVLFDLHGTLAQLEPMRDAVRTAALESGTNLSPDRIDAVVSALVNVGWVGGGRPAQVPASLIASWENRDLDPTEHRTAFVGLAEQVERSEIGFPGLAEQMYQRMIAADGWVAYADTVDTLTALRHAGVPVALVSNIGFDARPVLDRLGIHDLLDEVLLSYEVGAMKPSIAIFDEACRRLNVSPQEALMVGDTEADAGARAIGIRTLLMPFAGPGELVGLDVAHAAATGGRQLQS